MSKVTTEKKQSDKAAKLEASLSTRKLDQQDRDEVAEEERRISGMMKDMDSYVGGDKINVGGIVSCFPFVFYPILDQIRYLAIKLRCAGFCFTFCIAAYYI